MDANGTRFHLLLGREDWARCADTQGRALAELWAPDSQVAAQLRWDPERCDLTLQPRVFQFVAAPKDNPPRFADRRGAGRDPYGNWYWVAGNGSEILVNSEGTRETTHFW